METKAERRRKRRRYYMRRGETERDSESWVTEGRSGMYEVTHRVVGSRKPSIGSTRRSEQIGSTSRGFWESRIHRGY